MIIIEIVGGYLWLQKILVKKKRAHKKTLYEDIMNNTDFGKMLYSDHNEFGVKVIACTHLKSRHTAKNYLVTTVWQITPDKKFRLITLVPGGEGIWNFIYSIK